MSNHGWIVVRNWTRFQHYHDRDPIFIKNYISLLSNDDYLSLSGHQRSILHGVWLAYASTNCQLRADTGSLTRRLALRVSSAQLKALANAGFIELSASKPLALRARSREEEAETEEEKKEKNFQEKKNDQPVDNHSLLLAQATADAEQWQGSDSLAWDQHLDQLEHDLHGRLNTLERDRLWDRALGR